MAALAPTEITGPLAGVVVLDLTQVLSGPFATMVLADLGADVIKVEPFTGDLTRSMGPPLEGSEDAPFGGYFASINRNKRSIALNLKDPRGVDLLRRMVAKADVLIENMRAGVMDRLGVGYETLQAVNPQLVYASIRGFGDPRTGESPYVDWPAYDLTAQAMGGLMSVTGPDADHPVKVGPGLGDIVPGLFMTVGIVSAVHHARDTGRGQLVDIAMYDAVVSVCERIVYQYTFQGVVPEPQGNSHPLFCPFDAFPAVDGMVTIAALSSEHWRVLANLIDRPELGDDPRFVTNAARLVNAEEVRRVLGEWTSTHTKAEIAAVLGTHIPFAPVNTAADIVADPHLATRDMLVTVDHPNVDGESSGLARIAGVPLKFSETPGGVRHRAPMLGEHSDEVLAEFGVSADEIAALREADVLR